MEFHNDWQALFDQEIQKPYLNALNHILAKEYKTKNIYPPKDQIFSAFLNTPMKDVKVVILGQDPYHGPGQAHGLAFSVNPDCPIPPSLRNIYQELEQEYGVTLNRSGDLHDWAKQGVLLLNPILTVEQGHPLSHQNLGWQDFTNEAIKKLNELDQPIVFMLWGSKARQVKKLLNNPNHLILESAHPSPLSAYRGFFGNNHFKQANDFLLTHGQSPIDWTKSNL
jgi:uracil-DNA glycosylase